MDTDVLGKLESDCLEVKHAAMDGTPIADHRTRKIAEQSAELVTDYRRAMTTIASLEAKLDQADREEDERLMGFGLLLVAGGSYLIYRADPTAKKGLTALEALMLGIEAVKLLTGNDTLFQSEVQLGK